MPHGMHVAAIFMLWSAILGLAGALLRLDWIRLALFMPQQIVLGIMAGGGMLAAHQGMYFDGTIVPWQHIYVDQMGMVALFIAHLFAILRRCWDMIE